MASETREIEIFCKAELLRATSASMTCRAWMLAEIWGITLSAGEIHTHNFYFDHYEHYCSKVEDALSWLRHIDVAIAAKSMLTKSRADCVVELLKSVPAEIVNKNLAVDKWISFIAHSILFVDVLGWRGTETIRDMLARSVAVRSLQTDSFRMPRSFNARTIAKVAGINVQWTTRLTSHLEVSGNDCDVAFFHCPSVLQLYQQSKHSTIFPKGFLCETSNTISLLLPRSERSVKKWLHNENKQLSLDGSVLSCAYLKASDRNIQKFNFYRDRLIILKEVFEEHEPRGILQFWRDDRKPVQWWTFWIAITVFALTLIGCVEGALQVYKAFNPENNASAASGCAKKL